MMEGMELGIRGWLIVIGGLLILAVLLDGYRRIRQDRYGKIRMSIKAGGSVPKADDIEEFLDAELPNGGARVVSRQEELTSHYDDIDDVLMRDSNASSTVAGDDASEAVSLDVDTKPSGATRVKPAVSATQGGSGAPDQVITIRVIGRQADLGGEELLSMLLAADCRFGEMDIFHRYEEADQQGAVQFSVANMVEPGTFDLDQIKQFNTPGIVFFMQVPGPNDPLLAFEAMIEAAKWIASKLDGEVRGTKNEPLSVASIESMRQKLRVSLEEFAAV